MRRASSCWASLRRCLRFHSRAPPRSFPPWQRRRCLFPQQQRCCPHASPLASPAAASAPLYAASPPPSPSASLLASLPSPRASPRAPSLAARLLQPLRRRHLRDARAPIRPRARSLPWHCRCPYDSWRELPGAALPPRARGPTCARARYRPPHCPTLPARHAWRRSHRAPWHGRAGTRALPLASPAWQERPSRRLCRSRRRFVSKASSGPP
mmetsp:Transcript_4783/g.19115  ORF Transcript_4783/g.19115 Transcript_4783/m.19115 type:complete len:211 (-) Transcript_4783:648-1280(-)